MYGISTKGIIPLIIAILLISLLPAAFGEDDNASMNKTILKNTTLKNATVLNKTDITAAVTDLSSSLPVGPSILHLGKGLNKNTGITGINRSDIISSTQSISYQSFSSELKLGNPAKPMKDLEKVVFICNIL